MENDTIMIPIPAPPEGWVFEGFRIVRQGEYYFWNGTWVLRENEADTINAYLVAVRVKPKWTPPPEWAALLGHCWVTRDRMNEMWMHQMRPKYSGTFWESPHCFWIVPFVRPELLPPHDIPADQCCWEIGGDQ